MDFQFDTVVRDRPIILSKLLLLHFLKKDVPALSWEFFVNRFETLSLEAQLHLDCNKDFPFPTSRFPPFTTTTRLVVMHHSDSPRSHHRRTDQCRQPQRRGHVEDQTGSLRPESPEERAFPPRQREGRPDGVEAGVFTPRLPEQPTP